MEENKEGSQGDASSVTSKSTLEDLYDKAKREFEALH